MTNYKLHEDCKILSKRVYPENRKQSSNGWTYKETYSNQKSGFYSEIYSKDNKNIMVIRGTELKSGFNQGKKDVISDTEMGLQFLPSQMKDAEKAYIQIIRKYGKDNVILTGHSLGGSLAEIVSGIRGNLAVTFNAYGIRDMFRNKNALKEDNVVNYVNEYDAVSMVNGQNHIGEIYAVSNDCNNKLGNHKAENIGDLSKRVQKTPKEIKETAQRIHPNSSQIKDVISGKIIQNYESRRNSNLQEFKHAKQQTPCVGSYQVSGYTRSDGVKVEDYIRKCGAKHGR